MAVLQEIALVCKLLAVSAIFLRGAAETTGNYTHQYYVKPNITSRCSPHQVPCMTLDEYAVHPEQYFTSDTQLVFLPGEHSLNTTLWIRNVTNLAMVGSGGLTPAPEHMDLPLEPSSQIRCTASVAGILLEEVFGLFFHNLTVSWCGNMSSACFSALAMVNTTHLDMSGVTVRNSIGVGFCGSNILGSSTITNTTFALNNHNSTIYGGNVQVFYSYCSNSAEPHKLSIDFSQFLYGNNDPTRRKAYAGGLNMVMECTNVAVVITNSTFVGNTGHRGGNVAVSFHNVTGQFTNSVTIHNCNITNGSGDTGGGLHVSLVKASLNTTEPSDSTILTVSNTKFMGNHAAYLGAGMYLACLESPLSFRSARTLSISGCNFTQNEKGLRSAIGGVAVHVASYHIPGYVQQGVPQLKLEFTNCNFTANVDKRHYRISAALYFREQSSASITNCSFLHNHCTAITAVNSNILFAGRVIIRSNHGNNGGGIVLCDKAIMYFKLTANLILTNNTAKHGGAVYAETNCLQARPACFFQIATTKVIDEELLNETSINITLTDNRAVAGSAVFGGSIDYCYLLSTNVTKPKVLSGLLFNTTFHISDSSDSISLISSYPVGVCLCTNGKPDCYNKRINSAIYPGQRLQTSVVVVGQRNGAVQGTVVATAKYANITKRSTSIQTANCSTVHYEVHAKETTTSATIQLESTEGGNFKPPEIHLTFLQCPVGFVHKGQCCTCDNIRHHVLLCDINGLNGSTIVRRFPEWIGYDGTTKELLYHTVCPLDYCKPIKVNISTGNDTFDQDAQCAFQRTGLLCGKCGHGLSLVLGSFRCRRCPNVYLLILIPISIAGILLVLLIAVCNLTVTEGTINGIVFYVNIVQLNNTTFFPVQFGLTLTHILTIFTAWLNLDLGIETCLYDGLDAYAKTWLQYAFPAYICVIAAVITYLSRRITVFARLVRRNGVQLLATLFFLAYAKLLHVTIVALTFGFIQTDRSYSTVWLHDGNIPYFSPKLIPLLLFALVLGFITLPFTLVLSLIQCLERVSNRKLFSWVCRLKPLMDAYTGPYKDNMRYWTGLLLLIRILLFVTHALNVQADADLNHMVTAVVCFLLLAWSWLLRGGPYKNQTINALEASFILNLGILCIGTIYVRNHAASQQKPFVCTMVTIALATFLGMLIFRATRLVKSSVTWKIVVRWVVKRRHPEAVLEPVLEESDEDTTTGSEFGETQRQLARWQRVVPFDQYREPLLASEVDN